MSLPPELAFVFGEVKNVFHQARVISREMIAESTLALTIERPAGFEFTAGENTMISIPGPQADDLREFTIASAPYEQELMIAMRVRNTNFKHAVYALAPGDALRLRDPAGTLWEASDAPQVWLSGGIGITPFRSIARELIHKNVPLDITHIHSDRTRSTAPFLQEFESYAAKYEGFTFLTTMTRESPAEGLRGRISGEMIAALAPRYIESNCYIVGTDSFVAGMRETLMELGVSRAQVRTERFDGYKTKDS